MSRKVSISVDQLVVRGLARRDAARVVAAVREQLTHGAGTLGDIQSATVGSIRDTVSGRSGANQLGTQIAEVALRGGRR